jgi:hypothetical protein
MGLFCNGELQCVRMIPEFLSEVLRYETLPPVTDDLPISCASGFIFLTACVHDSIVSEAISQRDIRSNN